MKKSAFKIIPTPGPPPPTDSPLPAHLQDLAAAEVELQGALLAVRDALAASGYVPAVSHSLRTASVGGAPAIADWCELAIAHVTRVASKLRWAGSRRPCAECQVIRSLSALSIGAHGVIEGRVWTLTDILDSGCRVRACAQETAESQEFSAATWTAAVEMFAAETQHGNGKRGNTK